MDQGTRRRERGQRLVVAGYSAALTLLLTGPLLGPGYLLLRDAVSTPRSHLTDSALGLGDAAPRAVPQDAVLAVVSTLVDGGLAVKAILLLALWSAGYGAAVLVRALFARTTLTGAAGTVAAAAQLVAVTVTLWNPYVAERLLQGHWSLLVGYAALPWTASAAYRIRAAGHRESDHGTLRPRERTAHPVAAPRGPLARGAVTGRAETVGRWAALTACLAAAGSTPTGALLAGTIAIVTIGLRRAPVAFALAAIAAAPWLTATVLSGAGAEPSDPAGASAFAARAEPGLGTLGSLAGLGGIWNADAVPDSRTTALAVIGTLTLLAVVATGVRATATARRIVKPTATTGSATLAPRRPVPAPEEHRAPESTARRPGASRFATEESHAAKSATDPTATIEPQPRTHDAPDSATQRTGANRPDPKENHATQSATSPTAAIEPQPRTPDAPDSATQRHGAHRPDTAQLDTPGPGEAPADAATQATATQGAATQGAATQGDGQQVDAALAVRRALLWTAAAAVVLPALAATGWGLAVMEWLIATVPGAGLLRDTQKYVALAVPGYALCAAAGCLALGAAWQRRAAAGPALVAAGFVVVLMVPLLDLAWGVGGQLRPVRYPPGWERVAAQVHGAADVAVLPGGMFRKFPGSGPVPVLDPAPRMLPADVLQTGELPVHGRTVAGEGTRAVEVERLLLAGASAGELAARGVGWVLVERTTPGPLGDSAITLGELQQVYADADLALYRVPEPVNGGEGAEAVAENRYTASSAQRWSAGLAHGVWAGMLVGGLLVAAVAGRQPIRQSP